MKFGKLLGVQQENNSHLYYVQFKLLKRLIKDITSQLSANNLDGALTANTVFEEELAKEIQHVNKCFTNHQRELLQRIEHLSKELQSGDGLAALTGNFDSLTSISLFDLFDRSDGSTGEAPVKVLRHLVEVLRSVDQFREHAVWNAVATVKILKKRRKMTSFGLQDTCEEWSAWLSWQKSFNSTEFAELHTAIESLGRRLVSQRGITSKTKNEKEQCPICLDIINDVVELACHHRFCWKCFVLGPVAYQPGEYRITQCPICCSQSREVQDAGADGSNMNHQSGEVLGTLHRFLKTYLPELVRQLDFVDKDGTENPARTRGVGK